MRLAMANKRKKSLKRLNVIIVGAGMYVCGRGSDGHGTIMPAICEWQKRGLLGGVYVITRTHKGIKAVMKKMSILQRDMSVKIPIKYFSKDSGGRRIDYKEIIRKVPRPACAIVAVPDYLHREIAGVAIENGLHTLVVKPLAPTLSEGLELIDIQKKKGVYCAVEFHKRFDHANMKLKDSISQGKIGEVLYFLAEYSQRKSMPSKIFRRWVGTTNVFQYLGIHYVDIIYFATGAVPKRAMAIGQKGWLASKKIDAYDSIQAVIEWEMPSGKKFASHILTNWIDPEKTSAMSDQKIKVIGTRGRFESDQKGRGITIVTDDAGPEEPNPYFCSAYGKAGSISYYGYGIDSVSQFLDDVMQVEEGMIGIDELEKIRPTFKESIIPTKVLEAVNQSLKNKGRWVEIGKD